MNLKVEKCRKIEIYINIYLIISYLQLTHSIGL